MATKSKMFASNKPYQSTLSRREALKWLGALSASAALPILVGCEQGATQVATSSAIKNDNWPQLKLPPITGPGYGKDPNLIIAPKNAWPRLLTAQQLTLVATISDIIVPREGNVPSASEVKVPEVVNEWVSAPYARQQADRVEILNLLAWFDGESQRRFKLPFVDSSAAEQLAIIDDIAYKKTELKAAFVEPANAFSCLRKLVLAAFFCSPEGIKDIGYLGNVAIAGDYPGPTKEAMAHLNVVLADLGLSL